MKYKRESPIEINKEDFKTIGYALIDSIANFIDTIDEKKVTTGESPEQIQNFLGTASLPENGSSVSALIQETSDLLMNHSLLNGHPKFLATRK